MARTYDLLVKARGDTRDAQSAVKGLDKSLKSFSRSARRIGGTLTTAVTAPLLALGALGVKELMESRQVAAQTNEVFKSMGAVIKIARGEFEDMVASLSAYSAIDGDIIQSNANIALSFKALASNPQLLKDTMRAAVDMSAALDQDLKTSIVQLGKAMQNGAKGASALSRNGTLAKDDIADLQKMAADGVPIWKQQEFILKAVNKQYKGQGKNKDPLKAIAKATRDLAESMAELLLPAITLASKWMQRLSTYVDGLSASKKKLVGVALLLAAVVGPLVLAAAALASAIAAVGVPIAAAIAAGAAFWSVLGVIVSKSESLRKALSDVVGVFMRHKVLLLALVTPIGAFITLMVILGKAALNFASTLGGPLKAALKWVGERGPALVKSLARPVAPLISSIITLGQKISGPLRSALAWLGSQGAGKVRAIASMVATFSERVRSVTSALAGGLRDALNWIGSRGGSKLSGLIVAATSLAGALGRVASLLSSVISSLNSAIGKAKKLAEKVGDKATPNIGVGGVPTGFARGGLANEPSIFGEAGPEWAVPAGNSPQNRADRQRVLGQMAAAGHLGGGGITIYGGVTVVANNPEEFANALSGGRDGRQRAYSPRRRVGMR